MLRAAAPRSRHSLLQRRFLATAARPIDIANLSKLPPPGLKLRGFTLERAKHVPELELSALQFKHDKTGADYIHVARDDRNNVFCIGFKTNPPDATGLPHILEHTTLCGSKTYPVRDPFFKMLNRSLSNFMNAFTSSDHTTYPFATTNRTDYMNLMDVYLDATLFPLLKESDFKQEGWRIGPENPAETDSPLAFKGVVYNEMKGQMSDGSYLFYKRFQDHIIPSVNNSGGDPAYIPDLTIEQLRNFHREHYHPSNAKIFSYGNFPLESTLEKVDQKLSEFDKIAIDTDVKEPITLDEPTTVIVEGPLDPLADKDAQSKVSLSWITCDTSDVVESFALQILSSLLMDGYGSPMYKALIETQLGAEYSPNSGYDSSFKKGIFSIGLQNVKEHSVRAVGREIIRTLKAIRNKGFEDQKVEGILHQLEIALKHKTANFGMGLMQRVEPAWFNGVDPFDTLKWNEIVSQFRERYKEGGYLEGLLEKYLIDGHPLTFVMNASPNFEKNLQEAEAERLEDKLEELGGEEEARERLVSMENDLLELQEKAKSEDLSSLPTLHVKDIPRSVKPIELRRTLVSDVPIQWRVAPTNGLTYFRIFFNFDKYSDELRKHLPLYAAGVFRLGTPTKTMEMIEDEIKLKTGGITCSPFSASDPCELNKFQEGIVFSGYCLDKNFPALLEILRTLIMETDFTRISKVHTLVKGMASGAIDGVAERGHAYAQGFAAAHLTVAAQVAETVSGLAQVKLITNLAQTENYSEAMDYMKYLSYITQGGQNPMRIAVTCGQEAVARNEACIAKFLGQLHPGRTLHAPHEVPITQVQGTRSFFPLPFQVNYTATSLKTVHYMHQDSAALTVLGNLLTHKHLHHEIREKGGAYGGGASHGALSGIFSFYSYRDPNPQNTMDVVRSAGEFAVNRQWTERDLEEAKLSIFQGIDAPKSVSSEGMSRFLEKVTDAMKQLRREAILDVSAEKVQEVAQKYLVDQFNRDRTATVVIGPQNDWATKDNGWAIYEMSTEDPNNRLPMKVEL
ncbi:Mitochondrial presequence protease [Orbilia brochopaga]|uniref:Presequence protease, mitochondrial n=1 Tax=Orbilia brochopaga TaxID=3140254 RepID=A0AAV9U4P1_9PEZI